MTATTENPLPEVRVLPPRMVRVCMYCRSTYGYTPCLPREHGQRSHGICPECNVAALHDDELMTRIATADAEKLVLSLLDVALVQDEKIRRSLERLARMRFVELSPKTT